jgi:hypothetical protein
MPFVVSRNNYGSHKLTSLTPSVQSVAMWLTLFPKWKAYQTQPSISQEDLMLPHSDVRGTGVAHFYDTLGD